MYVKIINPATNGRKVYANTNSTRRTTNYLEKEAKESGQVATFFGSGSKGYLSADEVVSQLGNNQKGLGKEAAKFYSLVLSPGDDELAKLGGGDKALERYTQNVMQAYAENFNLKGDRKLGETDLVWAATIHHERKNRGTDDGKQGEQKPGLQTHVHLIVSARDAEQKITLNPLGTAARFNRVEFQAQAGAIMDEQLGRNLPRTVGAEPASRSQRVREKAAEIQERAAANRQRKPLTPEQMEAKDARLEKQVERLNSKAPDNYQVDAERVKRIARESNYDNQFYARLGQLERKVEQSRCPPDPYDYLKTGKSVEKRLVDSGENMSPKYRTPPQLTKEFTQQQPTTFHALERTVNKLAQALPAESRTQDVRSEEEKRRDFEYELYGYDRAANLIKTTW